MSERHISVGCFMVVLGILFVALLVYLVLAIFSVVRPS